MGKAAFTNSVHMQGKHAQATFVNSSSTRFYTAKHLSQISPIIKTSAQSILLYAYLVTFKVCSKD